MWDLGQMKMSCLVNLRNVGFETDENVLFIEVSLIQRCLDREVPLYGM